MGTFRPDRVGIGEMLCAPFIQAEMLKRAEAVKARAEATAPVDLEGPHPGRYKESFHVTVGIREATPTRSRRAEAKVINDSPEAFFVEFGTKNNPQHRTLGHALEAAKF